MRPIRRETPADAAGQRLDRYLADALGVSRREAQRLIAAGAVTVGGRSGRKGQALRTGDHIEVTEAPAATDWRPEPEPEVDVTVVHADDHLLVADKPAGQDCHPNRPGERGTLVAGLLARYPELAGVGALAREPGLVNRLDRDTSGLVLVARTDASFATLKAAFGERRIDKRYLALVHGRVTGPGQVDWSLAHHADDPRRMVAVRSPDQSVRGKLWPAHTGFRPLRQLGGRFTLVRAHARTGRMHQVRVHLAAAGHPIAGDPLYAPREARPPAGLVRQFLHASHLALPHPADGETLSISSDLPADLAAALGRLGG